MLETIIETQAVMTRLFAALHTYVEREKASLEKAVHGLDKNDSCRRWMMDKPEGQRWRGLACPQLIAMAECMAILEHAESGFVGGKPVLILREDEDDTEADHAQSI